MKRTILTLLLLLVTAKASSHPHSFIAMQTQLVTSGDRLTGLKMIWTMDEITSADLLYDAGAAGPETKVWKKLAAEVMANVLGQHYFTEIWQGDKRVKFLNLPPEYRLSRNGPKAVLEFILPLAEAQPLAGQRYRFLTFDPTYFVDMYYDNTGALSLPSSLQTRCQLDLHTPKPDASLQQYALSLDKADAPPEERDLGRQFAQTVMLTCH